ncbi:hypothetical protein C922_00304 [Plasmodium inui San Antonio 1]|uniref:Uncharacterized protein n=1 Tax=Plasmodium inui San Antonio 1 TaxID=1237626 RepID=W7AVI7_9APIC|nr:hypothetical protein C922_00304 [Plasmodium inui San Antonio 1]EUD69441.1 hypothetical protein C922_00304 [Plasmodium inui San Antonio 1]
MYRKYGLTGLVSELEEIAAWPREDTQRNTQVCPENCSQDEHKSDVPSEICELFPYKVNRQTRRSRTVYEKKAQTTSPLNEEEELANQGEASEGYHIDCYTVREGLFKI